MVRWKRSAGVPLLALTVSFHYSSTFVNPCTYLRNVRGVCHRLFWELENTSFPFFFTCHPSKETTGLQMSYSFVLPTPFFSSCFFSLYVKKLNDRYSERKPSTSGWQIQFKVKSVFLRTCRPQILPRVQASIVNIMKNKSYRYNYFNN